MDDSDDNHASMLAAISVILQAKCNEFESAHPETLTNEATLQFLYFKNISKSVHNEENALFKVIASLLSIKCYFLLITIIVFNI